MTLFAVLTAIHMVTVAKWEKQELRTTNQQRAD